MKSRLIWAAVLLAAVAGFYYTTIRPTNTPAPGLARKARALKKVPAPEIPPPPLPEPVMSMPAIPLPDLNQPIVIPPLMPRREERKPMRPLDVPIQDNATIDFSIGAPVVRSGGKDQEALDKALKEMADAVKDVTFPPAKK
jgi:hypothetical protein